MKLAYYQDIRMFPDAEVGSREIGEKLFFILHLEFVKNKDSQGLSKYALSFPEYSKHTKTLGRYFRVMAYDRNSLNELNLKTLCERMSGYVECSDIEEIPETNRFLCFERVQGKTNSKRLMRRMIKRKGVSSEEAKEAYKGFIPADMSKYPYVSVRSISTGQNFKLYINCIVITNKGNGGFNMYGLSNGGNVPDF